MVMITGTLTWNWMYIIEICHQFCQLRSGWAIRTCMVKLSSVKAGKLPVGPKDCLPKEAIGRVLNHNWFAKVATHVPHCSNKWIKDVCLINAKQVCSSEAADTIRLIVGSQWFGGIGIIRNFNWTGSRWCSTWRSQKDAGYLWPLNPL